ncbi:hypothetical protein DIZ27_32790 [Streptomyces sp. NWU339]|uniref:hypothetical protein n=1 Tax=Streptomyces sp. NWU339 TaxID=2185284 RepID=UPI000D67EE5B|nr:hypothetical protein [Streptomyces sp. NWU339]PWI06520.1 hypothetical protein DIZ27_32790 [Streptomyces sp. NWU339]
MSPREIRVTVTTAMSEPRSKWCPGCKAMTALAVDVFGLFPTGVVHITTVAVCELCDDPDDQQPPRTLGARSKEA